MVPSARQRGIVDIVGVLSAVVGDDGPLANPLPARQVSRHQRLEEEMVQTKMAIPGQRIFEAHVLTYGSNRGRHRGRSGASVLSHLLCTIPFHCSVILLG